MKKILLVCLMLGVSYCLPTYAKEIDGKCGGKERWSVKVLDDTNAKSFILASDVNTLDRTTKITTIHELRNMKLTPLKQGHNVPRQDFEKQVYVVIAKIDKYKHETDADLHIVIVDPDTNKTMIAESPDPSCHAAIHSGHADIYKKVRKQISSYTAKSRKSGWSTFKSGTYKITGVLFQDFIHGQTGVAPNGLELHPILDIEKLN